jgi:hypothetical protein
MQKLTKPIQIFFSSLFPAIVLKNKIVSTIVYNIATVFGTMKDEADIVTNSDI